MCDEVLKYKTININCEGVTRVEEYVKDNYYNYNKFNTIKFYNDYKYQLIYFDNYNEFIDYITNYYIETPLEIAETFYNYRNKQWTKI